MKAGRADTAFDGEGAGLYGGRWNHPGSAAVYVSDSLALAALEYFVHLGSAARGMRFVCIPVELPDAMIDSVGEGQLPPNWREEPAPEETRDIGTRWLKDVSAVALRVPSVIVPVEFNLLLNPAHEEFSRIKIGKPRPFDFDPRMWK